MAKTRLLFVCSGNMDRSPTAEQIYLTHPRLAVKSAGTRPYANMPISADILTWADAVAVMESCHERHIRAHYADKVKDKPIFRLDIRDDYRRMEDALIAAILEKMEPVLELLERLRLLKEDIDRIRDCLSDAAFHDAYDFATDVRTRMDARGLSANALAARCLISHPAVGKWLNGTARPHGKDRMKDLGMALGMDETDLNDFLLKNGYMGLNAGNPWDAVCKRVLWEHAGEEEVVRLYRAAIERHRIGSIPLPRNRIPPETALLSERLKAIDTDAGFDTWLEKHASHFDATDKTVLPGRDLTRFILLHVGHSSVNDMYIAGELPKSVRRLLYPLRSGDRDCALRGLREKLILFGLYMGMTDADIDRMLGCARLMPLTNRAKETGGSPKPTSKTDAALVAVTRRAHERCPYYEYECVQRVKDNIVHIMAAAAIRDEKSLPAYDALRTEYLGRLRGLRNPYGTPDREDDEEFEDLYADHLSNYVRDALRLLVCYGDLTETEIAPYVKHAANATPAS
ncbi:MAG: hypothetical protein LBL63_06920 [Clostridiales Family XIII bacterium]|nr:hypothetical protein [Clostridiales Family XIII bacterium]